MKSHGDRTIWIVDDDTDEHTLVTHLFKELGWSYPVEFFETGEELLAKLEHSASAPFIIISDVNLPKMDGFAVREKMLQIPNNKFHSVPFIFWSTQVSDAQIHKAYLLRSHGFFKKEATFDQWKLSLAKIIDYWMLCLIPSREDKYDQAMM